MPSINICIIGDGYIGSYLASILANTYNVTIVTRTRNSNIPNVKYIQTEYQYLLCYHEFDTIIHTAGNTRVKDCDDSVDTIDNNVLNLLKFMNNTISTTRIIYLSSCSVYKSYSVSEETDAPNPNPSNYYDLSKQMAEMCIRMRKNSVILRLSSVAGMSPVQKNDILLNKMVNDSIKENLITILVNPTEGSIKRGVLGLTDLGRAIRCMLGVDKWNSRVYNISSFNSSVKDIAKKVSNLLDTAYTELANYNTFPSYSFQVSTQRFERDFNFKFTDTIESLVSELIPWKILDKCLVCNSSLDIVLDLGKQALANNYWKNEDDKLGQFPLKLMRCTSCFHNQIDCKVDPTILFSNYLYKSGTSNTGKEYFKEFAQMTLASLEVDRKRQLSVLDIACNDGSQLDQFLGNNCQTVGVDPAKNLCEIANKSHDIHCGFFDDEMTETLLMNYEEFDIIIAQNVFAHIDYPKEFLVNCSKLMNTNSTLYIQTSQARMIFNNEFDTVYHEHLSFFNANSMHRLIKEADCGLYLNRIEIKNIHGGSYLFTISMSLDTTQSDKFLQNEIGLGIYEMTKVYKKSCEEYALELKEYLIQCKKKNFTVIGYGSTAKSNTVLNYIGANNKLINCIIDENELKQGLKTPTSNIPIIGDWILTNSPWYSIIILVLAWNFFDEIKEKILVNSPNAKIVNIADKESWI